MFTDSVEDAHIGFQCPMRTPPGLFRARQNGWIRDYAPRGRDAAEPSALGRRARVIGWKMGRDATWKWAVNMDR